MAQEQMSNQKRNDHEAEVAHESTVEEAAVAEQQAKLGEKAMQVDDLLDDIDDVLEENAQEFVDAFVQKGGQ